MKTFLLLGANLGDRVATLQRAVDLIWQYVGAIEQQSPLYETTPWGIIDQPAFLNQVIRVKTTLEPEVLLKQTQAIEQDLGRIRKEKWGARVIDIDILYYDQLISSSSTLTLPHPYLHQRRFTLVPLADVAPDFVHPLLHKTTLELLAACTDEGVVSRWKTTT
ncbi:2-amino-4-hydroxy-6-hydroxymethyldihydropteridine diphosphokinase [Spirosoma profusum]|uniref:2-amino-4-hydroxy-6- hydroxymethyldihydropteridine diphosphokinase n=1 Tax=Spirosoma profusum TaxID=2771354 RepID=UPI001CC22773|nr:2-amino-4-hydroxy-6-hydroxymethyldihydropteridine diphosphokinase [Spirosoma profusum]